MPVEKTQLKQTRYKLLVFDKHERAFGLSSIEIETDSLQEINEYLAEVFAESEKMREERPDLSGYIEVGDDENNHFQLLDASDWTYVSNSFYDMWDYIKKLMEEEPPTADMRFNSQTNDLMLEIKPMILDYVSAPSKPWDEEKKQQVMEMYDKLKDIVKSLPEHEIE